MWGSSKRCMVEDGVDEELEDSEVNGHEEDRAYGGEEAVNEERE